VVYVVPKRPPRGVTEAARHAKRDVARMSRPAGAFDARRYFRGNVDLQFYNVGTDRTRALARAIHDAHRDEWTFGDAVGFADTLIKDRHLEVKHGR
jgi:hypothetical protein